MSEFKFISNVTKEQFDDAIIHLQNAIDKKDTPKEWVRWTANTLLLIGKIAVDQFGYGPAINLIGHLFGDNKELMKTLEFLLKEKIDA
jgi:hypothetical protein